jgi:hypothetical protein
MGVITRKDYQAAIESCQYSMGIFGLKNFIDDFIREHNSTNTDILSSSGCKLLVTMFTNSLNVDVRTH